MSIEVKLPEIGEGIESGDVLSVYVQQGDRVEKDQPVVELETDKATVDVPSTHAGVITSVHVSPGDSVAIGATLVTLEVNQPAPSAEPPPVSKAEPVEQPATPVTPESTPQDTSPTPAPGVIEIPPVAPPVVADAESNDGADIAAGPAIRRFARELGVDLSTVQGTGEGGRIMREDVLGVVRQASQAGQAADASQHDDWGPIRVERMSKIRRTIAAKMHSSWLAVPRVTNFDDADVTELENIRQSSKADYAERGIKLTSMAFLIKAVAMSLRKHPFLNAALDPDGAQIVFKDYVNIGIAVDTERGLVVPALREPDVLSIPDIASQLSEMAGKVRGGKFAIDDLRGGTFTISNLGSVGGTYSTPIVNVPEVAILLVGRSRKMPVAVDDEIKIRLMMPLSLSYDHRLVDGATAARFLNEVIGYLEAPTRLLLAT